VLKKTKKKKGVYRLGGNDEDEDIELFVFVLALLHLVFMCQGKTYRGIVSSITVSNGSA